MFGLALNAAMIALVALLAIRFAMNFTASTETGWRRWWDALDKSVTVVWGWLLVAGGKSLDASAVLATWLNAPDVSDWIKAHATPEHAAIVLTAIGLVTIVARLRSVIRGA